MPDSQVATNVCASTSVVSTPLKIRIKDIELDKENALFGNKPDPSPIWIAYVTSQLVESHYAVLVNEFTHGEDWAVHVGVLKRELKELAILVFMGHTHLTLIRHESAVGHLVTQALLLALRLLKGMVRNNPFAVGHGWLAA